MFSTVNFGILVRTSLPGDTLIGANRGGPVRAEKDQSLISPQMREAKNHAISTHKRLQIRALHQENYI